MKSKEIKMSFNELLRQKPFIDENDNICVIIEHKQYIAKMNEKEEITLYEKLWGIN